MAEACMWCGHAEQAHSAVFGECGDVHLGLDGVTRCMCKEYAPAHPARSLWERTQILCVALIWWSADLVSPYSWVGGPELRTLRDRIHFLEEHTR
jgi:hypothetical protein